MLGPLLLSAGIALTAGDGLAPGSKGYATTAGRTSVVVRPEASRAGDRSTWRVLLSDAQSDAPIESAQVDLTVYGPAGATPQSARARPGDWPGHYLVDLKESASGRYAAMLAIARPGTPDETGEVAAIDGIDLVVPAPVVVRRPGFWYWGAVAALLLIGALLRRRRGPAAVAAALGLLLASGAHAHDTSNPGDRVPGSQEDLAQELQFALGVRTQPVAVLTFEPPRGSGLGERQGPGVPRSAVVERDGKKLVFVRLGPERFAAREVRLGWRGTGDTVSVTSGLQPGELVVVAGAAFLRNGGAQLP